MPSAKALKNAGTFRVFRIDEPSRDAFKSARAASGLSVADFLTKAIETDLPKLVAAVLDLGIRPRDPKARPVRLPLGDSIAALQEAANKSGLDQSALVLAMIRRASGATKLPLKKARKTTKAKPVRRGRKAVAR